MCLLLLGDLRDPRTRILGRHDFQPVAWMRRRCLTSHQRPASRTQNTNATTSIKHHPASAGIRVRPSWRCGPGPNHGAAVRNSLASRENSCWEPSRPLRNFARTLNSDAFSRLKWPIPGRVGTNSYVPTHRHRGECGLAGAIAPPKPHSRRAVFATSLVVASRRTISRPSCPRASVTLDYFRHSLPSRNDRRNVSNCNLLCNS